MARFHICLPVFFLLQKWVLLLIKMAIYLYNFIVNHPINVQQPKCLISNDENEVKKNDIPNV